MSCKQKFTTSISLITLGVTFTLAFSHRAEALTFDLSYDSSVTSSANASEIESATQFVADEYSSLFSNNVTLNIDVVASTSVGLSDSESSGYYDTTYSQVRSALIKNDPALASSLPATNPDISTGYFIPNAEAKALGLFQQDAFVQGPNGQNYDGIFTFNPSSSYSFNEAAAPPSNGYDFIGLAEHEFSEIMGRVSGVTVDGTFYASPYDLYSYTAPGVRSYNADVTGAYFSLDQGTTNLNTFNNHGNGGDARDWAGNTLDAFNAFGTTGVLDPLVSDTPVDIEAMNAIGWTSTQSVPFNIPGGATIPAFGSVLALGVMRKVRKLISNNH